MQAKHKVVDIGTQLRPKQYAPEQEMSGGSPFIWPGEYWFPADFSVENRLYKYPMVF